MTESDDGGWDLGQAGASWGTPLAPNNPFGPPDPPPPPPPEPAAPPPPTTDYAHLPPPPPPPPPSAPAPEAQPRPAGADLGYYPAVPRAPQSPRPNVRTWRSPSTYSLPPRPARGSRATSSGRGCNPLGLIVGVVGLLFLFGNGISSCLRSAGDVDAFRTSGEPSAGVVEGSASPTSPVVVGGPHQPSDLTLAAPAGGLRTGALLQELAGDVVRPRVVQLTFGAGDELANEAWASDPLDLDAEVMVASTPYGTYVASGHHLHVLSSSEGKEVWGAVLDGDPVRMDAFGDVVVVTQDAGHVTAFGATDAKPLWTADLPKAAEVVTTGTGLLFATDVTDTSGQASGRGGRVRVEAVDPRTGKRQPAATIGCWDWGFSPRALDGRVARLPDGDLVTAPMTTSACFARWSPTTGAVRWAVSPDLPMLDRNVTGLPVVAAHHLAVRTIDGDVVAVALATGTARRIPAPAGFDAWPRVASGDLVAAEAISIEGTPHAELMGFDLAEGRVRWRTPLSRGVMPARLANASIGGVAMYDQDQLRFVEVLDGSGGEIRSFRVDAAGGGTLAGMRIDPQTGTEGILLRWVRPVGVDPYVSEPVRQGDRLVVRVGEDLVVLPLSGDDVIAGVP